MGSVCWATGTEEIGSDDADIDAAYTRAFLRADGGADVSTECLHPSAVPKVAESYAHQLTHLPTLSFVLNAPRLGASFGYSLRGHGEEG